jgi:hypothetical protein
MSEGKQVTVFDDNKDNGCIAISGMGYYIPLPNHIEIEAKNRSLSESLRKEKSRNAFIEVTGKSLAEIRSDAINEMVLELTKHDLDLTKLNVEDIYKYTNKLVTEQ